VTRRQTGSKASATSNSKIANRWKKLLNTTELCWRTSHFVWTWRKAGEVSAAAAAADEEEVVEDPVDPEDPEALACEMAEARRPWNVEVVTKTAEVVVVAPRVAATATTVRDARQGNHGWIALFNDLYLGPGMKSHE
jgi:hypothetical protein